MTNYSRSVIFSNGLRHLKNLPVKFDFSPIDTPANIAKKLPSQRCSQPLFIAFFNFSHKRPTFAFTGKSGYTLGFTQRIAHSNLHAETGAVSDGGYHYPRTVSHVSGTLCGRGLERQTLPLLDLGQGYSRRTQRAFGTAIRVCASRSRGVAAPQGWVVFLLLSKLEFVHPAFRAFPRVRDMGGITTLGVLCVLLKHRTAACKSG